MRPGAPSLTASRSAAASAPCPPARDLKGCQGCHACGLLEGLASVSNTASASRLRAESAQQLARARTAFAPRRSRVRGHARRRSGVCGSRRAPGGRSAAPRRFCAEVVPGCSRGMKVCRVVPDGLSALEMSSVESDVLRRSQTLLAPEALLLRRAPSAPAHQPHQRAQYRPAPGARGRHVGSTGASGRCPGAVPRRIGAEVRRGIRELARVTRDDVVLHDLGDRNVGHACGDIGDIDGRVAHP